MKYLLLFGIFTIANPVFASCYIGFACSIDSLQMNENVNAIENYFVRNAIEPSYISGSAYIFNYNDLFLFNTIV